MKITTWVSVVLVLTGVSALSAPQPKEAEQKITSLPFVFFIDSSVITRFPSTWQTRLKELNQKTSSQFEQQFAVDCNLTKVITVKMKRDTAITVDAAFNALVGNRYPGGDTISVLLYTDSIINADAAIGETEIGRKQIALREISYADSSDTKGWAIIQARTLLHELGHSFGAIHVSDIHSVMNHSPSPIGAVSFDTLNAQIIQQALHGNFGFSDHSMYLQTVSRLLTKAGYRLADYPGFFTHYLPENSVFPPTVQSAVDYDSFIIAALGLRLLSQNDSTKAVERFDSALAIDSAMAVLWYYRGLATSDISESNRYLKQAAEIGYYLAQELLTKRETETAR